MVFLGTFFLNLGIEVLEFFHPFVFPSSPPFERYQKLNLNR